MMTIVYKKHDEYPESILVKKFEGDINADDIIKSWEDLKDSNLMNTSIKGIINELDSCNLNMNMDGFKRVMMYLNNQAYLKHVKIAVVTENPKKIIFPILGEQQEKNLKIKPFSTNKAAVHWITIDI